jgi:hypothetical protein
MGKEKHTKRQSKQWAKKNIQKDTYIKIQQTLHSI